MITRLSSILLLLILLPLSSWAAHPFECTQNLPVAYEGRFRSLDSAAGLWLYDLYHRQQLKSDDLLSFNADTPSAIELLWKFHFFGHDRYQTSPLFWIHYAEVKSLLGLKSTSDRFSFQELSHALYEDQEANLRVMKQLVAYEFAQSYQAPSNRARSEKLQLSTLSPGLWVALRGQALVIASAPPSPPWHFLKADTILDPQGRTQLKTIERDAKISSSEILKLLQVMPHFAQNIGFNSSINEEVEQLLLQLEKQGLTPHEISLRLESKFPSSKRLQMSGTTLKMLPARSTPGEWFSLHALGVRVYDPKEQKISLIHNFTSFSDTDFYRVRESYFNLEASFKIFYKDNNLSDKRALIKSAEDFSSAIADAYGLIADTPYRKAAGKQLYYPSLLHLKAETFYNRLPLINTAIAAYGCALILFLTAYILRQPGINRWAIGIVAMGFLFHTSVLVLRCYILQRPPVSNMFETVVYVPWVAVVVGFLFYIFSRTRLILAAACVASLALLILLKLTHADSKMENVQAVLDSQYWLIVHVLMVVGSYGAFAVSGILGHFYLVNLVRAKEENLSTRQIAKAILQTMYTGVALLIPGTILGGIWAAESWGRFWDWDPKESWAFISACIYLLVIHAYTFKRIGNYGLAVGSIAGLMAISFTWYGVNYILGTGLHSYGFGSGGEGTYYFFLLSEMIFLISIAAVYKRIKTSHRSKNEN